jgi:hypothetical protein
MFGRAFAVFAASVIAALSTVREGEAVVVDKNQILALHNKYRAELGVPPLRWSDKLAYGAEQWAKTIAGLAQLQHSGTSGIGENLAFWKGSPASIGQMLAVWAAEKNLFTHGAFPQISRDGNWLSASHYSQMIWRTTTEVGCGADNNGRMDFLVCWYSPQGNYVGAVPY